MSRAGEEVDHEAKLEKIAQISLEELRDLYKIIVWEYANLREENEEFMGKSSFERSVAQ